MWKIGISEAEALKNKEKLCAFMCLKKKWTISEFTIDDALSIKDLLLGRVVYSLYFSCQDFSSTSFTITSHPFFVFAINVFFKFRVQNWIQPDSGDGVEDHVWRWHFYVIKCNKK